MGTRAASSSPAVWPVLALVVVDLVVVTMLLASVGAANRAVDGLDPATREECKHVALSEHELALPDDWPTSDVTYVGPETIEFTIAELDGEPVRVRCTLHHTDGGSGIQVASTEVLP